MRYYITTIRSENTNEPIGYEVRDREGVHMPDSCDSLEEAKSQAALLNEEA